MPSSLAARITRMAISPRLATSRLLIGRDADIATDPGRRSNDRLHSSYGAVSAKQSTGRRPALVRAEARSARCGPRLATIAGLFDALEPDVVRVPRQRMARALPGNDPASPNPRLGSSPILGHRCPRLRGRVHDERSPDSLRAGSLHSHSIALLLSFDPKRSLTASAVSVTAVTLLRARVPYSISMTKWLQSALQPPGKPAGQYPGRDRPFAPGQLAKYRARYWSKLRRSAASIRGLLRPAMPPPPAANSSCRYSFGEYSSRKYDLVQPGHAQPEVEERLVGRAQLPSIRADGVSAGSRDLGLLRLRAPCNTGAADRRRRAARRCRASRR